MSFRNICNEIWMFKNFIVLWCHLAKTQLLSFIHIVQIDLSSTQTHHLSQEKAMYITYSVAKVLRDLCGFPTAGFSLDDQNLVMTNGTQQVVFERKDWQTATRLFHRHRLLLRLRRGRFPLQSIHINVYKYAHKDRETDGFLHYFSHLQLMTDYKACC